MRRPLIFVYFFFIVALFLYSFTQVDLGLSMTKMSLAANIQRGFQYVGYFNRPLSAVIYLFVLLGLFISYGVFMYSVKKKIFSTKLLWKIIVFTSIILTFSYNAFSYDLFNYIFDAKIFTHYQLNPYLYKPLDFPNDPMLSFMHWTHRTFPYGPIWLGITVPISYLGLNFFLPTFFLFKLLAGVSYLGTIYAISQIMRRVSPDHERLAIVFFAFNPLVLIEVLISGHNDIVMMCLAMFSILLLVKRRYVLGFVLLLLSIGVKFASGLLLPLYAVIVLFERKHVQVKYLQIFPIFILAMLFAVFAASLRTTFQPWYLIFVIPFASLVPQKNYIMIPVFILSIAALLNYLPYLYLGNWDKPVPMMLQTLNITAVVLAIIVVMVTAIVTRKRQVVH